MSRGPSQYKMCTGIPLLKVRRSHDHLIFNMGIPIPGKTVFILRWSPCDKRVSADIKPILLAQKTAWVGLNILMYISDYKISAEIYLNQSAFLAASLFPVPPHGPSSGGTSQAGIKHSPPITTALVSIVGTGWWVGWPDIGTGSLRWINSWRT